MFIGTPRGAFTPILDLFLEVPPRVFPGILSEYQAQKYSPELVNKDFGDFLVMVYISIRIPRLPPAYPLAIARVFFTNQSGQPKNIGKGFPKISLSKNWLTPMGKLGGVNFCTQCNSMETKFIFYDTQKKTPCISTRGCLFN